MEKPVFPLILLAWGKAHLRKGLVLILVATSEFLAIIAIVASLMLNILIVICYVHDFLGALLRVRELIA